jgi:hypothetical protein
MTPGRVTSTGASEDPELAQHLHHTRRSKPRRPGIVPIADPRGPRTERVNARRRREVEEVAAVEPEDDLAGVTASVKAASDLTGVPEVKILGWLIDRQIRTERKNGVLLVDVADVARLAGGATT